MTVKIRRAKIEDIAALCVIEQKAFDAKYYYLINKRQYRYLIEKGNSEVWLAESNHQVCGCGILLFRKNLPYGRFYSLVVDPSFQGGSIGKILFDFAEKRVTTKKMSGLTLEIRADNEKLLQRYKNLGYTVYGMKENYYPDGSACIKLIKKII